MRIGGTVHAQRLRVEGELRLRGADVTGEVNLTDAMLLNPGDTALDAWGMYEQLATLYRQIGREADARTVLLAKQRRRRQLSAPGAAWSLLQDVLIGYGYRPGRAALWLLVLTAVGTIAFSLYPLGGGVAARRSTR